MAGTVTRREFLRKSLTGTGLVLAISCNPFALRVVKAKVLKQNPSEVFVPSAWLRIAPDNTITVMVNKSEMGQGVCTSLPMIVAEELEADWETVRFESAPAREAFKDPVWGIQSTGGSTSVRHMFSALRKAGAAAREMLIQAAATVWQVPEEQCFASSGAVKHRKSNKSLTYGELCAEASSLSVPDDPPLKQPNRFSVIGTSKARLDIPDKVHGTALFGTDVLVPDMLYAAVERPPAYGARLLFFNKAAAERVPGVQHVVSLPGAVAVCAENVHAAWKGRNALDPKWGKGAHPDLSNESIERLLISQAGYEGATARLDGNPQQAFFKASRRVEATYLLPYLAHAAMEPINCTAHVQESRCDVWIPTQNQSGVRQAAAKLTALGAENVHVHTTFLGGGFGRRYETGVAEEAIHLSKETGRPVMVLWTRMEDMQHDFYRPANGAVLEAAFDPQGLLAAWSQRIVAPSIFSRVQPELVQKGVDPSGVEGVVDMEYEIPHVRVEYIKLDAPVPVGFWRSVGHSHNAFTVECFMDELAFAAGQDPLDFRLKLLKNHPRTRRVLRTVAEKAGWGKPLPEGRGLGIAQHRSFGTHVAHAVELSVDKESGMIQVHRVVCAVDCGLVIHPDTVTAQLESAVIMGLSAALKERVLLKNGAVISENYEDYEILRMDETPQIEVHIVGGDAPLGGIGEPGLPPVAPAVANAVFAATGARIRRLPLTPDTVLEGMAGSKLS
jgi:isoquinoline 1-oxidoreductase beta subunit